MGELLELGHLFRYQTATTDVADLEREFSRYIGVPYTMACNSGGCGLFLALKAIGVKQGDKVLVNTWTLSPVAGAIVHAGACPVFVAGVQDTLTVDFDDLEVKAKESGAKVFLCSYMRGQVPNMDRLMETVRRLDLTLVEDCAHTLGATWQSEGDECPRHIGAFGAVAVWSLQTNKSMNSGEGGIISTSLQSAASFITVATGSYGHYRLNGASGDATEIDKIYESVPNFSMRMTTIAAALALPQLKLLPAKCEAWRVHAMIVRKALQACPHTHVPPHEDYNAGRMAVVWSSIQFELVRFSESMVEDVIAKLAKSGVTVAWFGGPCKGFTSTLRNWGFADPNHEQWNSKHAEYCQTLLDLPLYHTTSWSNAAFEKLATILVEAVSAVAEANPSVLSGEPTSKKRRTAVA